MILPLSTVKEYMRIDPDYTGNDAQLTLLIDAVQEQIEGWLNVGLELKEREYVWDGIACELPYGPVKEIISTHPETGYTLTGDYIACNVYQELGRWWYPKNGVPTFSTSHWGSDRQIKVVYVSGYEEIPAGIKSATLAYIDHLFRTKGSISEPIPDNIKFALKRYNRNSIL